MYKSYCRYDIYRIIYIRTICAKQVAERARPRVPGDLPGLSYNLHFFSYFDLIQYSDLVNIYIISCIILFIYI